MMFKNKDYPHHRPLDPEQAVRFLVGTDKYKLIDITAKLFQTLIDKGIIGELEAEDILLDEYEVIQER